MQRVTTWVRDGVDESICRNGKLNSLSVRTGKQESVGRVEKYESMG